MKPFNLKVIDIKDYYYYYYYYYLVDRSRESFDSLQSLLIGNGWPILNATLLPFLPISGWCLP